MPSDIDLSPYQKREESEDEPLIMASGVSPCCDSRLCCGGAVLRPLATAARKLGPTGQLLVAVVLAVVIGIILKSEDVKNDTLYKVLNLPGRVWINGFKLVILPLIFSNIVIAVQSLKGLPSGGQLGGYTLLYYFCTTSLAIATSLILCNLFVIPNMGVIDLESLPDDSSSDTEPTEPLNVLGQIERILFGLVPGNIVTAANDDNLMGVIAFAIAMGLCITDGVNSVVLKFFKELSDLMMKLVGVLSLLTPIGVFSLVLPKIATIDTSLIAKYLGLLLGVLIAGLLIHVFISLSLIFFITTRSNPYAYLKRLIPAMITAFGTSSSAATLPITSLCTIEYNNVQKVIADFVLPLGATMNMDGTAVKYPLMVIWMAAAQGIDLSVGDQCVLAIVSVLSSVGAAPIPTAGVAMWVMVLNATGVPVTGLLGLMFAIEWLVDRLETVVNITSDGVCAGVMNKLVPIAKLEIEENGVEKPQGVPEEEEP